MAKSLENCPHSNGSDCGINPYIELLEPLCALLNQEILLTSFEITLDGELAYIKEEYRRGDSNLNRIQEVLIGFNGSEMLLGRDFLDEVKGSIENPKEKPMSAKPHPIENKGLEGYTAIALPSERENGAYIAIFAPKEGAPLPREHKQAGELSLCISSDLQRNGDSLINAAREISGLKSSYSKSLPKELKERLSELETLIQHCGIGDINNACRLDNAGVIESAKRESNTVAPLGQVMRELAEAINGESAVIPTPEQLESGKPTPSIERGYSVSLEIAPEAQGIYLEVSADILAYALGEQIMLAELPLRYGLLTQEEKAVKNRQFACKVGIEALPGGELMASITVGLKGVVAVESIKKEVAAGYSPATAPTLKASLELLASRCKGIFRLDEGKAPGSSSTVFWPAKDTPPKLSAPRESFIDERQGQIRKRESNNTVSESAVSNLNFALKLL